MKIKGSNKNKDSLKYFNYFYLERLKNSQKLFSFRLKLCFKNQISLKAKFLLSMSLFLLKTCSLAQTIRKKN